MNVGTNAGIVVQIAQPTGRHRVSFRGFCKRVAKSTTFNRQEVEAVLNYATEIARDIMSNGNIVEFGDLGTLKPSFKSKAVPQGEVSNVQKNIEKSVVRLSPSNKYFSSFIFAQTEENERKRINWFYFKNKIFPTIKHLTR